MEDYEAAIRTTTYNGKSEDFSGNVRIRTIQSYQLISGERANIWESDKNLGNPVPLIELTPLEYANAILSYKNSLNDLQRINASERIMLAAPCTPSSYTTYTTTCYYATEADLASGNATCYTTSTTIQITCPTGDGGSTSPLPGSYPPSGGGGGSSSTGGTTGQETNTPNLRLSFQDQQKYPKLALVIKNLKSYVSNTSNVLAALIKYTGYTKEEIFSKLGWGSGPQVTILEMTGKIGHFDKTSNTIELSAAYVRGLEISENRMEEACAFR